MGEINVLPLTVVQKLEEAEIPQDSLIFYQNNRWVYQIGQPLSPSKSFHCQRIESLGPFGKNFDDIFKKYSDKFVYRYSSR
jgi:hypothetical protein